MTNTILRPKERIQVANFVGGEWVKGSGPKILVESPYFGEVVGEVHESTAADVDRAVQSGHKAFLAWREQPIKERTQVLFRFRENLLQKLDEISQVISLESGKTLQEARAGLMKGVEVLEFSLSLQNMDDGGRMEVSRGVFCEYRREPLGVVVNITPFNFPAMVPMWTIPIAIVLGNAYIWKPSEKTPLTSKWLAETLQKSGLPNGVFQVVQGGASTVEALIDHPLTKAIGFVGSSRAAKAVYTRGTNLGKRVLALGGAKNHIVLLPDADPQLTGRGISDSFTGCAGQRCMAASVVLAVSGTDALIEKIVERAASLKLGTDMGAIITKSQVEFLHEAITRAEKAGAKILLDGRKAKAPAEYAGGFWLGPTLLDRVTPDSETAKVELFGPILTIMRVSSISEAMDIENRNPYGNACSVFTRTGSLAEKVIRRANAGMVGVNVGVPVPREPFSFGGINESKFGHGDITGPQSLDFWSDLKKVTTKWESQNDETWMS
jgi:malonate-semialdehyde dehydrogenase (acetylating)/methylmalonate-semialdehyde dehydrogenase